MSSGVKQSSVLGCVQMQYFYEEHSQISRWPKNKTKQKHLGSLAPLPLAYLGWNVLFEDPSKTKCQTYLHKQNCQESPSRD